SPRVNGDVEVANPMILEEICIHQYNDVIESGDGIGNSIIFIQELLKSFGFRSEIYVNHASSNLREAVRWLKDLNPRPNDILLIHHSILNMHFERLAALKCRKVMIYHRTTPPKYFDSRDSIVSELRRGFAQIEEFRGIVEASAA